MKCELAAALIHRPEVLFLDEPTLGLDVQAQRRVREFVSTYAARTGATVLLTSHYMADIEALAERVLVIHHGRLQFDGALKELAARTSDRKLVTLHFDPAVSDEHERVVEVQRSELRDRLGELLDLPGVLDFTVEDEPIERVMERVFETPADSEPAHEVVGTEA
jgi:ABC-2 type transport system ATP-binding protein